MARKSCLVQVVLFVLLMLALAIVARRTLLRLGLPEGGEGISSTKSAPEAKASPGLESSAEDAAGQDGTPGQPPGAEALSLLPKGIEGLSLQLSRPLMFNVARIRGLAASERFFFVSSYDPEQSVGFLFKVNRDTLSIAQVRKLKEGGRYQPGGIDTSSGLVWVALTEGGDANDSVILALDDQYLETQRSFRVGDCIRAVAVGDSGDVYGFNCDANAIYEWTPEGQELRKAPNAGGASYKDADFVRGSLVCAGKDAGEEGLIDVLDPGSLSLLVRHRCYALSSQGRLITEKAFAFADNTFFFVPDQGEWPMLLSYVLDEVRLEDYVPSVSE